MPDKDDLRTPGERLRFMRRARGMTQEVLARTVYVTQPAVAQWEADKWLPTPPTQVLVAEALGTTRLFLFGEQTETVVVAS